MNKGILVVTLAAVCRRSVPRCRREFSERPPGCCNRQESTRSRRRGLTPEAPKATPPPAAAVAGVDEKSFVIGPEDQIQVDVWGDPRIRRSPAGAS